MLRFSTFILLRLIMFLPRTYEIHTPAIIPQGIALNMNQIVVTQGWPTFVFAFAVWSPCVVAVLVRVLEHYARFRFRFVLPQKMPHP